MSKAIRELANKINPLFWSGRADLNRRPLGPEPSALAGLSHAPNAEDYTASRKKSEESFPVF